MTKTLEKQKTDGCPNTECIACRVDCPYGIKRKPEIKKK